MGSILKVAAYLIVVTFVLFQCEYSLGATPPNFGPTKKIDNTGGFSRTIMQYQSCINILTDLQAEYQKISGSDAAPQDAKGVRVKPIIHDDKIEASLITNYFVGDLPLLHIPNQEIIIGSSHGGHFPHRTVNRMGEVSGYYALYPYKEDSTVYQFMKDNFLSVKFVRDTKNIKKGQYYLVPIEQYIAFREFSQGERKMEALNINVANRVTDYSDRADYYSPGTFRTRNGTQYVFLPGGRVNVYQANGEQTSYDLNANADGTYDSQASHKAILKKQGVAVPDTRDPVLIIKTAIAAVEKQVVDFQKTKKIEALHLNVRNTKLSEWLEKYEQSKNGASADYATYQIEQAIKYADEFSRFLPPHLGWQSFEETGILYAPVDEQGQKIYRVIKPILAIKKSLEPKSSRSYELRFISGGTVHLQGLFAALGNLGLALERDRRIFGGNIVLEYSPKDGALQKITYINSGLTSLANEGERLKVEKKDLELIQILINNQLPSKSKIEVEFKEE